MNCTHGSTAHMRPGDRCAYCGTALTADDIVVAAPHGAARVAPVVDGGASLAPVVSSGHGIARPDGSAPPPHPVGSTSAPEVAADRKDAAGSSFPGFTASGAMSLFDQPTARATDPATAHAAAGKARGHAKRDRDDCLLAHVDAGQQGLTGSELANATGRAYSDLGPRRPALVRAGLVELLYCADGRPLTRTNRKGNAEQVYRATSAGVSAARELQRTAA